MSITPHFNALPGDFAPTVLMPGDPLRAEHIANHYLTDVRQVNSVRGMLGFTGTYQKTQVSVMGSGMGIPSISIYATELFQHFSVEQIIRVGSCGAIGADIELQDVLIGMGACTDSLVNRQRLAGHDYAAIADYGLLETCVTTAKRLNTSVRIGNLFSADLFYTPDPEIFRTLDKMGVHGVEMEAAGLYGCAAECGKKALAICTVSDHVIAKTAISSEARQKGFDAMFTLALETTKAFQA
jgi:purine-nucleoside phosphorylase